MTKQIAESQMERQGTFALPITQSPEQPPPNICPNCGRKDTVVVLGDFGACAACGYSTEGLRGCT